MTVRAMVARALFAAVLTIATLLAFEIARAQTAGSRSNDRSGSSSTTTVAPPFEPIPLAPVPPRRAPAT